MRNGKTKSAVCHPGGWMAQPTHNQNIIKVQPITELFPHVRKNHGERMGGADDDMAVQHTTVMAELEEKFITSEDNNNDNQLVRFENSSNGRQKRPRRGEEQGGDGNGQDNNASGSSYHGSSYHPIEIDDNNDNGISASAQRGRDSWTHTIENVEDLCPGDQIYVYRGAIQHHGIVTHVPRGSALRQLEPEERASAIQVVHFDSACDGVETTTLEVFLKGKILRRARYGAGPWASGFDYGASYAPPADDPSLIVLRATEAAKFGNGVSGWSGYSLLTNNCETFACWCSTGRRNTLSRQASRGLMGAGVVAASVSACAAAGAAAGGFAGAAGVATSMLPKTAAGLRRTVQALEWTAGAAAVAFTLADVASLMVTRSPVERNRLRSISSAMVQPVVD